MKKLLLALSLGIATSSCRQAEPNHPLLSAPSSATSADMVSEIYIRNDYRIERTPGEWKDGQFKSFTDNRLMVPIKGGSYTLGRNNGRYDEGPPVSIKIRSFLIDRTEVTNADFELFVRSTEYWPQGPWLRGYPRGGGNLPVRYVSWYDAKAYARWTKKRLPTEAEWEVAMQSDSAASAQPLGELAPVDECRHKSQWGVCGSFGSVREWTEDWYYRYQYEIYARGEEATTNPRGPRYRATREARFQGRNTVGNERSTRKAARGASWITKETKENGRYLRWAHAPAHWLNDVGIRLAADLEEQ